MSRESYEQLRQKIRREHGSKTLMQAEAIKAKRDGGKLVVMNDDVSGQRRVVKVNGGGEYDTSRVMKERREWSDVKHYSIPEKTWGEKWDAIFGNKETVE